MDGDGNASVRVNRHGSITVTPPFAPTVSPASTKYSRSPAYRAPSASLALAAAAPLPPRSINAPLLERIYDPASYVGQRQIAFQRVDPVGAARRQQQRRQQRAPTPPAGPTAETLDHATTRDVELHLFHYYANYGRTASMRVETIDNGMFAKFMRDCPGMIGADFEMTRADLCFIRCRPKGERRLPFRAFRKCLRLCAVEKMQNKLDSDAAYGLVLARHYSQNPATLRLNVLDTLTVRSGETLRVAPARGRAGHVTVHETLAHVEVESAYVSATRTRRAAPHRALFNHSRTWSLVCSPHRLRCSERRPTSQVRGSARLHARSPRGAKSGGRDNARRCPRRSIL